MRRLKEKVNVLLVVVFMVAMLTACSVFQPLPVETLGAPSEVVITPKQQATMWLDIYNAEYADTMAIMSSPTSTPAQREIGAKKKAILARIRIPLKVYVGIVDKDGTPDDKLMLELIGLINELATVATGGK